MPGRFRKASAPSITTTTSPPKPPPDCAEAWPPPCSAIRAVISRLSSPMRAARLASVFPIRHGISAAAPPSRCGSQRAQPMSASPASTPALHRP